MVMATTTREQLHRLVDRLAETELNAAKRYLEYLHVVGGIPRVLAEAPEEDEPVSPREAAALAEAESRIDRGELVPDGEFESALAKARSASRSR
jgi:hypothetical protein